MISRKIAADLYLNLLVLWEKKYKHLPKTGSFDIRKKVFTKYQRNNNVEINGLDTIEKSNNAIKNNKSFCLDAKQLIIFQKGDSSKARSLFRHLRNSVAHARVERVKLKHKWFLIFSAKSRNKYVLKAQIQESKLSELITALKSTATKA